MYFRKTVVRINIYSVAVQVYYNSVKCETKTEDTLFYPKPKIVIKPPNSDAGNKSSREKPG